MKRSPRKQEIHEARLALDEWCYNEYHKGRTYRSIAEELGRSVERVRTRVTFHDLRVKGPIYQRRKAEKEAGQ
jgi:hypothetical protein